MLTPDVSKVLELSTAHIAQATAKRIDHGPDIQRLIVYQTLTPDGDWGAYLIHTGDDEYDPSMDLDIPEDLRACVILARRLGCRWLMLDRDAPKVSELPTYAWS